MIGRDMEQQSLQVLYELNNPITCRYCDILIPMMKTDHTFDKD
jgi:hypothetical protein